MKTRLRPKRELRGPAAGCRKSVSAAPSLKLALMASVDVLFLGDAAEVGLRPVGFHPAPVADVEVLRG